MHRPFPPLDRERRGVFTTTEAHRAGWTRSALAHAVSRGRLIRLQSGIYVPAQNVHGDGPDAARNRLAIRAIGACLAVGPAVVSHASSAVLAGLPLWTLPARACVTVPPLYTGDAVREHLHRARLDAEHVIVTGAGPRTTTSRTVLDIAREHSIDDAVVAGDAAIERRMTDAARLVRCARFCAGWPGARRMRAVLALLDGRSESPLESVSRVRLARHGIPAPRLQEEIFTLDGLMLGRLDFYWDQFGVAGEVDGRMKYRSGDDIWREKLRQERMEDTGLVFVRWGRRDLTDMNALVHRLGAAFARGVRLARTDRRWVVRPSDRFAPLMHASATN